MKLKLSIILRKCNTFKNWSIDVIFPYNKYRAKAFLQFKDMKYGQRDADFIGMKRRAIIRTVNIPKLKLKKERIK